MSRIKLSSTELWSSFIMLLVGIMLTFLGLVAVSNQPEVYPDWIVETVAQMGTNETGELKVFWAILLLGIPGCLFINYLLQRTHRKKNEVAVTSDKKMLYISSLELTINLINLIFFLVHGYFLIGLVFAAIVVFLNYLIDKTKIKEGLLLFILLCYAILGIVALANYLGINVVPSSSLILILATFLDLSIFFFCQRFKILTRTLQILQVFIPLNILLYACRRYLTDNGIIILALPGLARAALGILIVTTVLYAIYQVFHNRKIQDLPFDKIILLPTIIIIFILNSVSTDTSLLLPIDLHHTGEEIISYQQIIGQGLVPYDNYSPVSGLFPVLIGSVLEIFGGNMTAFNLSHAVFMAIFAGITIYLVSKHLDKFDTLIVALVFSFPSYDRAVWIALSLLILMLPQLIIKRNLWLKIWLWLCFVGGLYYPSFGGAVLIGTLPFAIVQTVCFVKSGELKTSLKNWKFYICWILCLAPIIASIPLLLNLAKHVMVYSSQTNLADGISVLGQNVPKNFLPYLDTESLSYIRHAIYYACRYVIPMLIIWILILSLRNTIDKKNWKKQICSPAFLILTSCILTTLIGYTGTMVRQDPGAIVSRATYVIIPVSIVFFVFMKKYTSGSTPHLILLAIIIGTATILGASGVANNVLTSRYAYNLTSTEDKKYVLISEDLSSELPRLGQGFILESEAQNLSETNARTKNLLSYDPNLKFYGWGKLGIYYILDIPTVGQPSDYAAKSYAANAEIISAIKANRPVIGLYLTNNLINYYLYNWIMLNDDYLYSSEYQAFLPKSLYEKIYNSSEGDNKIDSDLRTTDTGRVANSMGRSLETLKNVLTEKTNLEVVESKYDEKSLVHTIQLKAPEKISGNTHDMLYLNFNLDGSIWPEAALKPPETFIKHLNDNVYVKVKWGKGSSEQMLSKLGTGSLLIPLGANPNWLLSNHQEVTVTIENTTRDIYLTNAQFYELRKEK